MTSRIEPETPTQCEYCEHCGLDMCRYPDVCRQRYLLSDIRDLERALHESREANEARGRMVERAVQTANESTHLANEFRELFGKAMEDAKEAQGIADVAQKQAKEFRETAERALAQIEESHTLCRKWEALTVEQRETIEQMEAQLGTNPKPAPGDLN